MIQFSAQKYIEQLIGISPHLSNGGKRLVKTLVSSLQASIEKKENLTPKDISFTRQMLEDIEPAEREHLINQHSLGLGASNAPIIFVGTEHAYDLTNTLPLTLEAIGLSILWLCNGKTEIFGKLSGLDEDIGAQFHIHPNSLYKVHETTRGQHTWKVISSILARAANSPDHYGLLTRYKPGLGDLAYQIELSAFPAKRSAEGRFPTKERLFFMEYLIESMRPTAKVIVFHGKLNNPEWHALQINHAKRFLNIPPQENIYLTSEKTDKQEIRYATTKTHKAIFTRALNGPVRNTYRKAVAELLRN